MEKKEKNEESVEKDLMAKNKFCWEIWNEEEKGKARELAKKYMNFLESARTERERVDYTVKLAEESGFRRLELGKNISEKLNNSDKVYYVNRNKNIALIIIGTSSLTNGVHFIGAHVDTPRIDLKIRPLYEDAKAGLALLKTHYYGGMKKYQWCTIPLHLTGVIIKTDGTKIQVEIGKNEQDPVFIIPDLLIHLSKDIQANRKTKDVIKATEMNVLAGSLPVDSLNGTKKEEKKIKEKFKLNVLKILNSKYGIIEADLQSAELSLVSGIKPRFIGFDSSLIGAAGQDDGSCTYLGVQSLLDLKDTPQYTAVIGLFDKEEIGSNGNTGAQSNWLKFIINDIMVRTGINETMTNLNLTLTNTLMISADVGAAFDSSFPSAHDIRNAAVLGKGIALEKYTGSGGKRGASDASAETMAYFRNLFAKFKVPYQTANLGEVDVGGGGTIAKFFAESFNCDVIDAGVPVLNMHSPYEVTHISDLYATYLAFSAFLKTK